MRDDDVLRTIFKQLLFLKEEPQSKSFCISNPENSTNKWYYESNQIVNLHIKDIYIITNFFSLLY